MTKIDIKETEGGGNPVSDLSNPEMIDNKMSDKNREGVSNESGYFEDDDESGSGLNQEDSIEIIFDKNASNNNSASSSDPGGMLCQSCYILCLLLPLCNMNDQMRTEFSTRVLKTRYRQQAGPAQL